MTRQEYIRKISEEWLNRRSACYEKKPPAYNSTTQQDFKAIHEAYERKISFELLMDAIKTGVQTHIKNHGNLKPPAFRYILAVAKDLGNGRKKLNKKEAYYDPAKHW